MRETKYKQVINEQSCSAVKRINCTKDIALFYMLGRKQENNLWSNCRYTKPTAAVPPAQLFLLLLTWKRRVIMRSTTKNTCTSIPWRHQKFYTLLIHWFSSILLRKKIAENLSFCFFNFLYFIFVGFHNLFSSVPTKSALQLKFRRKIRKTRENSKSIWIIGLRFLSKEPLVKHWSLSKIISPTLTRNLKNQQSINRWYFYGSHYLMRHFFLKEKWTKNILFQTLLCL